MIKKYIKKLINECLLEMKITSIKVIHQDPGKVEVSISNCTLISGGSEVIGVGK